MHLLVVLVLQGVEIGDAIDAATKALALHREANALRARRTPECCYQPDTQTPKKDGGASSRTPNGPAACDQDAPGQLAHSGGKAATLLPWAGRIYYEMARPVSTVAPSERVGPFFVSDMGVCHILMLGDKPVARNSGLPPAGREPAVPAARPDRDHLVTGAGKHDTPELASAAHSDVADVYLGHHSLLSFSD